MPVNLFDQRFQLMLEASLVEPETIELTKSLIERVERKFSLQLNEENGGAFAGHCALAIQRLRSGAPIKERSEDAETIVSAQPELYAFSKSLLNELLHMNNRNDEQEAVLIALYLIAMTDDSED